MENILSLLKFCSFILVISSINGIRYFFLKRKLKFIYQEYREEIHKAIRCDKIKVSSFVREPSETGNVMLDVLLFKMHRSIMWCILLLFFYPVVVLFLLLAIKIT
jgi:hypothetical protein